MHLNIVKKASRTYLEEMDNRKHDMPEVFKSINILQKTPFKVSDKVLQVAQTVWGKGLTVGKLPMNKQEPIPPKPFDIDTNEEAKKKWCRMKRVICDENETRASKTLLTEQILSIANDYSQYPKIYFPKQYDWRGRVYDVPQFFNIQSNDLARGLLIFANGKPLGSNEALEMLAVHGANCHGEAAKGTLSDRIKWVEDSRQMIMDIASDPHNHYDLWGSVDEPWQFLSFCFEWNDFIRHGETSDFITHLPCYSDCTNSGLQIFSGLLADERGGKATNLTPNEAPADIYKEVAEETKRLLMEKPDSVEKDMWLEYGIDRYTTKKVTMCIVYGLTKFSCRRYIQEHLDENAEDGIPNPFSTDRNIIEGVPTTFKATKYLADIVWDALDNVIEKAKDAMDWLRDAAKLVSENNLPITWTTPTGFIVQMLIPKIKPKRVNTNMGEKIWRPNLNKFVPDIRKSTILVSTNKIDSQAAQNAIAPCFVHSLDASVLQRAVCKANELDVQDFACIHDSFGVLAPDVLKMQTALRESFVSIFHNQNLLKDFADEIRLQIHKDKRSKLKDVPEKGTLDVSGVLDSLYFCS